mmetsp:Transcript_22207/g.37088  ORF Transcript_22207/g.37088 Transcript_22207/m.37088 type:complete len:231 (+) Transcript_22207:163-855(+)|eukprot:CAMPEP_0198209348 /NCGR_PEP_ID=MMETSP1445-20131203/15102_1 /TAXON_ID=36898 /ORGANISM="Pyramimonas sp., Strain CCMP2087" /LENGTH=230 /DNA_ID=CAMNT_0043883101 /DNA_START=157 /DNA_END=849 /DNA_ORIENTATION=+
MAACGFVSAPSLAVTENSARRPNGSVRSASLCAVGSTRLQTRSNALSLSSNKPFNPRGVKTKVGNVGIARASHRQVVQVSVSQEVEELPANLKKIVMAFKMVPDPMARYKQLLYFAQKLKPMPMELQIPENKVEGCVSQVWVYPTMEDGKLYFQAESDSALTKGLAALLVEGLSGSSPKEILQLSPDFIEMLGLKQSLTPSRSNGFLNMLRLMQKKTLELVVAAEKEGKL